MPATLDSADRELLLTRARLFETSSQAVIATTPLGTILHWSDTAAELYGWREEEVLGRDIVEVTPTSMTSTTAAELMTQLRIGRSWSGEFRVRRRDGAEFTAFVRDLPVMNDDGTLVGIVGVSTPLPERAP